MDTFIDEVVKLLFIILGPVLATAGTALILRLFAKAGIELDMTRRAVVEQKLGDLVALTEEWASTQIKRGISVTAGMKAQHYADLALQHVPGVTPEEATATAKTILGRFKVAAVASVSDLSTAAGK